jgi:hypothetical protein
MSRRFLTFPLAAVGLLVTATSAMAAGPSAIGTGSDGTSYVGYPGSGGIQRIAVDGTTTGLPAWGTPGTGSGQLGGAVAIAVAPGADGHVFVLDTNRRVQEFTKTGTFVKGTQLSACTDGTPDATKYGGLDVRVDGSSTTPVALYVAHPCADQVLKLDPASSTFAVTQTATTTSRPGRITSPRYLTGPANTRAVYVAQPDAKTVVSLQPTNLATGPDATRTYSYAPSDLFVDEFGVLTVADAANSQIHLYDSSGSEFRTLGGAGSDAGKLNGPQAFDVAGQDGTDKAGNLFIADSGNQRVQRWNPYGYTFWATAATGTTGGPPASQAPANSVAPSIVGDRNPGAVVTCDVGTWSGSPTRYDKRWLRNGTVVGTGDVYGVSGADVGSPLVCEVTAVNASGSTVATSSAATATWNTPVNTGVPQIQGTAQVGQTLTCTRGDWAWYPTTYAYSWRRDGSQVATGDTYALVAADAGRSITCAVTASNPAGGATAQSTAVTPTTTTTPPTGTRTGVTINNGAEATNTTAVSLRIRKPAGATAVLISNDGSFDSPTQVSVAANDTYAWTLDARGSQRRARVVYVRFVGPGIDVDQTYTDDILLDTTAPTVTAATVNSRTATKVATARVAAKDTGSGVQRIQYSAFKSTKKAKVLKLKNSRSFRVKPSAAKWVRAIDLAGNASKWKRVTYRAHNGRR